MRAHILPITLLLAGCGLVQEKRQADRYVLPSGYVGWVKITYDVPGAQPLPLESGHDHYQIPSSGHLVTSSSFETGWARDEFYYQGADGTRTALPQTAWGGGGMVWAGSNGTRSDGSGRVLETSQHFFIGTEKQYRCYGTVAEQQIEAGKRQPDERLLAWLPEQCR